MDNVLSLMVSVDHDGQTRGEEMVSLDGPTLVYPVVEKQMMTRLNVSGVPIGNIRFVLKLALSIICYWILPLRI